MEFTISEIGNFKIIHGEFEKNKYNIISSVLFKMENSYKDFQIYVDGIEIMLNKILTQLPKFYFVLFVDNSITNDKQLYKKITKFTSKQFVIIHYDCPRFKKNNYHIELFGTLIRYLFLFKFEQNKTKCVYCSDIDMENRMVEPFLENYKIFNKTQKLQSKRYSTKMIFRSNMIYNIDYPTNGLFMIYGGRFLGTYKMNLNILTSFLNNVLDKKISLQKLSHNLTHDETNNISHAKYKLFPYGVDEYFLNNDYINYIKEHNINHSYLVNYHITTPLFGIYKEKIKKNPNKELVNKYVIFLQNILNSSLTNPNKLYYQLNNLLSNSHNKQINEIVNKYYKLIKQIYKSNDYLPFTKQQLNQIILFKKNKYINVKMLIICIGDEIINKIKINIAINTNIDEITII